MNFSIWYALKNSNLALTTTTHRAATQFKLAPRRRLPVASRTACAPPRLSPGKAQEYLGFSLQQC